MQIHQIIPKTKSKKANISAEAENAALIRGGASRGRKLEREEK